MPQTQSKTHPLPDSDRPSCLKCREPMRFMSVAVRDDDHDLRTFECSTCGYSEATVVRCV